MRDTIVFRVICEGGEIRAPLYEYKAEIWRLCTSHSIPGAREFKWSRRDGDERERERGSKREREEEGRNNSRIIASVYSKFIRRVVGKAARVTVHSRNRLNRYRPLAIMRAKRPIEVNNVRP